MPQIQIDRKHVMDISHSPTWRLGMVGAVAMLFIALMLAAPAGEAQVNRTQHLDGWILAAARAPGLQGSIWRTDLWITLGWVYEDTEVTLHFCRSGRDNSDVDGIAVPLDVEKRQRAYYFEDVIQEFLGISGGSWVGAVHYTSNVPVQVWARVYSISADGRESYGQIVEGVPTDDMSPDSDPWYSEEHQWMFAAKHTSDGRYRVNVGMVNPTGIEATLSVQMYDSTVGSPGDPVWEEVVVPPFSMIQLSDPFAEVNGGEWNDMMIRVACVTEGGGSFGYVSVVDNATNDAYFVRGVKRMPPTE